MSKGTEGLSTYCKAWKEPPQGRLYLMTEVTSLSPLTIKRRKEGKSHGKKIYRGRRRKIQYISMSLQCRRQHYTQDKVPDQDRGRHF